MRKPVGEEYFYRRETLCGSVTGWVQYVDGRWKTVVESRGLEGKQRISGANTIVGWWGPWGFRGSLLAWGKNPTANVGLKEGLKPRKVFPATQPHPKPVVGIPNTG